MAIGAIGTQASAATKQADNTPTIRSKVDPAAKVPRRIARTPDAPTVADKRKNGGAPGKGAAVAGRAGDAARKAPSTIASAGDQLRERLKQQANRKADERRPNAGTQVGSVSGSARAELSSQVKAGLAGSAIDTARLANIKARVDVGRFRDKVADGVNSAVKDRIDGALTDRMRTVGTGLLADNVDVADGIAGSGAVAERAAIRSGLAWGIANGNMAVTVGSLSGASEAAIAASTRITGAVGAAAATGWVAGRAIDRATGVGGSVMGWLGAAYGDAMWNSQYGSDSSGDKGKDDKSSAGSSTTTSGGTQSASGGNANTGSGSSDQSAGNGNGGDAAGSSGNQQSASNGSGDQSTSNGSGDQTTSNGSGNETTSNDTCADASAGSGQCTSSGDSGTDTASTDDAGNGDGGKGTPNPTNETSTKGSVMASMALDRVLGGNQNRQQEKGIAARTGGGVTTPYDGAETSNVIGNLALDRQFNTGFARRQQDHIEGKSGGNVGQPGDDVNWNRGKASKVDMTDLNVVKAMQTGLKTPTVDESNAGNKAPKPPTVGGGFTGGGGGTTAAQASSATSTGAVRSSARAELQARLSSAMAASAAQVQERANANR
jgi:hypothetical protein